MLQRRLFLQQDVFVIALLAVAALVGLVLFQGDPANPAALYAEILCDGQSLARLPLTETQTYSVPGKSQVTLAVDAGGCGFVHSDCPDQVCVRAGFLSQPGQTSACLPNRVLLRIVRDKPAEETVPDTVA